MTDFSTFTLDNGLRVVHSYDPMTAMVAVDVLYNVGSRDEDPSLTGLAHLLEHMMFGGSVNIPHFDAAIERAGGSNNAWTSDDFTNYYDIAPAVNLDTLLWLESDRMLSLAFSQENLEVQRAVVIEEFKQTHLNVPYGDFGRLLRELLYTTHPYNHLTIGRDIEHLHRMTLDDVKHFFFSHYAPNNAVLAICGNVTLEEVKRKVEYWFGSIPQRAIAPREYGAEAPIESPRVLTVHRDCPSPRIAVAYPMGPNGSDDYYEGDLLTDLLAAGRASVFHGPLLRNNPVFARADASISGHEEPGYLLLTALLTDSSEAAVADALSTLTSAAYTLKERVDERALRRAIVNNEMQREFMASQPTTRAEMLAHAIMRGQDPNKQHEIYRTITPSRLREAAARIMDPAHSATLIYLPNEAK